VIAVTSAAMAVGAAVISALALASGAVAATSLDRPGTVRVTSQLVKTTRVSVAGQQPHAGDLVISRYSLYNKRITPRAIGHVDLLCTYTGSGSASCDGTYFLPRGKIVVSGVIGYRLFFQLAVVGGTGIYDNVRGTLTATATAPKTQLLVFRLTT
jgi:hypothetical protein